MTSTLKIDCGVPAVGVILERYLVPTGDQRPDSRRELRMAFDHLQVCPECSRELELRLVADTSPHGVDVASEEYVESRFADVTAITAVLKDEVSRRTATLKERQRPADPVRPDQPDTEARMVARFRARLAAAAVTPKQEEAMSLSYVSDLADADIAACVGARTPGSVTELRAQGRYRCKASAVVQELGLDTHRLAFLNSYYRPGGRAVAVPARDAVASARASAMGVWGKPASAIDAEHLAIMLDLVDRARLLDLHRRDDHWRTVFHAYFRSGMTVRPDPVREELQVTAEFAAMAAILDTLAPPPRHVRRSQ